MVIVKAHPAHRRKPLKARGGVAEKKDCRPVFCSAVRRHFLLAAEPVTIHGRFEAVTCVCCGLG